MNASTVEFERLLEQTPEQAALEIVRRLRMYAWLRRQPARDCGLIAWMAARIIRTQRMPPNSDRRAQRTWKAAAVKRGRIPGCRGCAGVAGRWTVRAALEAG
jgi:hypothetical protein